MKGSVVILFLICSLHICYRTSPWLEVVGAWTGKYYMPQGELDVRYPLIFAWLLLMFIHILEKKYYNAFAFWVSTVRSFICQRKHNHDHHDAWYLSSNASLNVIFKRNPRGQDIHAVYSYNYTLDKIVTKYIVRFIGINNLYISTSAEIYAFWDP